MFVWAASSGCAWWVVLVVFFFFQAEDGIRDVAVTGVQTCALPILIVVSAGNERNGPANHHAAGKLMPSKDFVLPFKLNRSEERRVGKSVDLGGRRIIKKKKKKN